VKHVGSKFPSSSQNTNKHPAAIQSNAPVQCKTTPLDEALFVSGKPLILLIPAFEALVVADGVNDGPMTTCEMVVGIRIIVVMAKPIEVKLLDSVEVFGVLGTVPVAIVTDGRPVTIEHTLSNAGNEKAM